MPQNAAAFVVYDDEALQIVGRIRFVAGSRTV